MSRKKERDKRNKGIKESVHQLVTSMVNNFRDVVQNEFRPKKEPDDYKYMVLKIIESIESNSGLNEESQECYEKMVELYPATKIVLDDLISQTQMFSIYEFEDHQSNMGFSAYIKKIEDIVNS